MNTSQLTKVQPTTAGKQPVAVNWKPMLGIGLGLLLGFGLNVVFAELSTLMKLAFWPLGFAAGLAAGALFDSEATDGWQYLLTAQLLALASMGVMLLALFL